MLTVKQAADHLGYKSVQCIYSRIHAGRLQAQKSASGGWLLDEELVKQFAQARSPRYRSDLNIRILQALERIEHKLDIIMWELTRDRLRLPDPEPPEKKSELAEVEERNI